MTEQLGKPALNAGDSGALGGERPDPPEAGSDVWYRGWECGFDVEASLWCAEGWRAYKGGADLDVPTASARTWDALLDEIDDQEDEL